jgi:hypothetical protein
MYLWCDHFADIGQYEMIPLADSGHKAKSHTAHSSYVHGICVSGSSSFSGLSNVVWP